MPTYPLSSRARLPAGGLYRATEVNIGARANGSGTRRRRRRTRRAFESRSSRELVASAAVSLAASIIIFVVLVCFDSDAHADDGGTYPAYRVLELFTSHGCSSCPPADRLLGSLVEADPALVALEYHVDYRDALVHGAAGNFVDPFSDARWSLRQRDYDARTLDGRRGVYTPQAIVDGRFAAVGSDAARIGGVLDSAPGGEPAAATRAPLIRLERDDRGLIVSVAGVARGERERRLPGHRSMPAPDTGEIALVRFLNTRATTVTGGENQGLELVNHRVVTAVETLGTVDATGSLMIRTEAPVAAGEGCAVLVRYGDDVPLLAGRLCPGSA